MNSTEPVKLKPGEHRWKAYRHDPDGTYDNMRCQVQTWKCEYCQTKLDAPDGRSPKDYEEETTCTGPQTPLKKTEKWSAPIKNS